MLMIRKPLLSSYLLDAQLLYEGARNYTTEFLSIGKADHLG